VTHQYAHNHPGDPAQPPADPDWRRWSQAWTRHVPRLTGRSDLTVVVAPGAGGGAPACTYPDLNRIEVDAAFIGDDPTIADPWRPNHKQLVPTAYGLLVHEAAHATHSQWRTPPHTPPVVAAVAELLEESRAENRQRQRRRGDRRWLHHTVTTLLTADDAPIDDPWHAGQVAGLLLARVDARILTATQTRNARAAVTTVLGRDRLRQLRELWRHAHTTDDTDADTMIDLAWQWCRIIGIDPHHTPQTPLPDLGQFAGRLAAAITDYLATAAGLTPAAYIAHHLDRAHTAPASWTERDPTPDEQAAARTLAARLAQARHHHTEPATRPTPVPPGRLRTRHAITADAQIAAGAIPSATPWQRRTQLPPPKPELRLAILVDTSGSMRTYMGPLSSASWAFAHAAHRNHATVTTIAFADRATLLLPPRHRPAQVKDMHAAGGTTAFIAAVKLADRLLDLRSRHTLRLLAVVSDGDLPDREPTQRLITTLHAASCAVLWLRPADLTGHTFDDTTTLTVADPLEAIGHIADAAITALENA
jgi:Mg-chelatase subunit ChlD